jgi:hypothetical protein
MKICQQVTYPGDEVLLAPLTRYDYVLVDNLKDTNNRTLVSLGSTGGYFVQTSDSPAQ